MAATRQLAISGGQPAVEHARHRPWPDVRPEDRKAVSRVLDRGVFEGANSPEVTALQREWGEYLGVDYCVAVNSGTASLHCCMAAAGVRPGDEVIVPAVTMSACAFAVIHQGGVPVFCDIDPRTYNLDPAKIEDLITERTRAIMAVHLHGLPADMNEIRDIAAQNHLAVVEDGAQAHGALYRGHKVGTLSLCAGFSVNGTKMLSGGEGGLFVTSDEDAHVAARRLVEFGETVPVLEPDQFREYWSMGVGWNYRNQELSAALARSQLQRLDEYIAAAQRNAAILTKGLGRLDGVLPPYVPEDRTHIYNKYRIRLVPSDFGFKGPAVELRDRVMQALRAEGVEVSVWQLHPLPAVPAFRRPPWPWHHERDSEPLAPWKPEHFQESLRAIDETFLLGSEGMPLAVQEEELMYQYVSAFEKVTASLDALLETPFEPIRVGR
jgi:perosamine synthetase